MAEDATKEGGVGSGQRLPRVFISYSNDSNKHADTVWKLANDLRTGGIEAHIDRYDPHPSEGWQLWAERQVVEADVVLIVCTETYLRRAKGEEQPGKGLGAVWEAKIIYNLLFCDASAKNDKFVPLVYRDDSDKFVPLNLKQYTRYYLDKEGCDLLYRRLTGQPETPPPPLGELIAMLPKVPPDGDPPPGQPAKGSRKTSQKRSELVREQFKKRAKHLADQEIWNGLPLVNFSGICTRVRVVESPFHGELGDYDSDSTTEHFGPREEHSICGYPLVDFATSFFKHKIKEQLSFNDSTFPDDLAPSVLLLTGDAGVGKSTALKILAARWVGNFIPIYVNLTDIFQASDESDEDAFEKAVNTYVKKAYDKPDLNIQNLNSLISVASDQPVVLILDSFDEAVLKMGQSRLTILSGIYRFCKNRNLFFSNDSFSGNANFRGIIIAMRDRPSFAERRMLAGATILALEHFADPDVEEWLSVFNRHLGQELEDSGPLCVDDFCTDKKFASLKDIIRVPLFLYYIACIYVVNPIEIQNIANKVQHGSREQKEKMAQFYVVRQFLDEAENGTFIGAGAFNLSYETDKEPIKVDADVGGRILDKFASEVGSVHRFSMEIAFSDVFVRDDDIYENKERISRDDAKRWAIRALPLELVPPKENTDRSWKFPHLSLVDFLVARNLLNKLKKHAKLFQYAKIVDPSAWFATSPMRGLTIYAAKRTISDRAFGYIEEHLRTYNKEDVEKIGEIAKTWSEINAIIAPSKEVASDDYFVCRRSEDLGLQLSRLGLPLYVCCRRALGDTVEIGKGETSGRHRLRQYIRLANFVLDSEFEKRTDVNNLPLRKILSKEASIEGLDMNGLSLEGSHFITSELAHASLLGANLRGSTFHCDCNLLDSNFVAANLQEAKFCRGLKIKGASFYKADFRRAEVIRCSTCNGNDKDRVSFQMCNLADTRLVGAKLAGISIHRCSVMYASLNDADLSNSIIDESILIGCKTGKLNLKDAIVHRGTWFDIDFRETIVKGARFLFPIRCDDREKDILRDRGATILYEYAEDGSKSEEYARAFDEVRSARLSLRC